MRPRRQPGARFAAAAGLFAALLGGGCDFGALTRGGGGTGVEGLSGTLVIAAGAPAAQAWVRVYPAPGVPALARAAAAPALDSAVTNASGGFRFRGLPDGTYNLAASLRQGDTILALYLPGVVVAGITSLGTDTMRIAGGLILRVSAGGAPLPGARCAVAGGIWDALSGDSGTCALTGIPPGSYPIAVSHPDYPTTVSAPVTVTPGVSAPGGDVDLPVAAGTPAAPALLAPAHFATGVALPAALAWAAAEGADAYRVQVARDSAFTDLAHNAIAAGAARAIDGLHSTATYYWRVQARNASGAGPWSGARRFATEAWTSAAGGPRPALNALAWTGSRFAAVGDSGSIRVGADGSAWTSRASPTLQALRAVAWTGGQLVAVGDGGTVLTSPDGDAWTLRATGHNNALHALAWTGTLLVAAGEGGLVLTSPDGLDWTQRVQSTTAPWSALAWNGDQLVLAGIGGAVRTSPDGITWTSRTSVTLSPLHGAAWTGKQFVLAGANGTMVTSGDGGTWTLRTSGTAATLRAIAWSQARKLAFAVGDGGVALISRDSGSTWTEQATGADRSLLAVCAGDAENGTRILAVGEEGRMVEQSLPVYPSAP